MRKRGVPLGQMASPQPVSLVTLLTEGLACPCCGVRIMLQASTMQAGMPAGHTVSAGLEPEHGPGSYAVPVAPRSPAPKTPHTPRRTEKSTPRQIAVSTVPNSGHRAQPLAAMPRDQRMPARQPASSQTNDLARSRASKPLPPELLTGHFLPPPEHQEDAYRLGDVIEACSPNELRGRPWPTTEEDCATIVDGVLMDVQATIIGAQSPALRQPVREWLTSQRKLLQYLGVRLTENLQAQWTSLRTRENPAALAERAAEEVWRQFVADSGRDRVRMNAWRERHNSLLLLISMILVKKLSFANQPSGARVPQPDWTEPAYDPHRHDMHHRVFSEKEGIARDAESDSRVGAKDGNDYGGEEAEDGAQLEYTDGIDDDNEDAEHSADDEDEDTGEDEREEDEIAGDEDEDGEDDGEDEDGEDEDGEDDGQGEDGEDDGQGEDGEDDGQGEDGEDDGQGEDGEDDGEVEDGEDDGQGEDGEEHEVEDGEDEDGEDDGEDEDGEDEDGEDDGEDDEGEEGDEDEGDENVGEDARQIAMEAYFRAEIEKRIWKKLRDKS
jgi:hypothetical protein